MKAFLNKYGETLGGILIIVIAFYYGKYSAPTKVETKTITVEVEKTKVVEKKVIIEKVNPDGSKTTVTTVDTNTETQTDTTSNSSTVKETKKPSLNVYAMGGLDVTNPANGFIVGAHVSKQLLGPISIGLFGFTNKTAGVSLGMTF
jgi:hypothetical protein